MSTDSLIISALNKRMETHRIGCFEVDFATCEARAHRAQRELDLEHVEALYSDFQDNIDRLEPLLAIYYGDRSALPIPGGPASNIALSIISGQHRVAALMKLEQDSDKWWNCTLYDAGMSARCATWLTLIFFGSYRTR